MMHKTIVFPMVYAGVIVILCGTHMRVSGNVDVQRSDALYGERANPQKSLEALQILDIVARADPTNLEAHWKAARVAWWAGTLLDKRSERLEAFRRGKVHGEAAVQLNPRSVEAQFWLGANWASFSHVNGIVSSLFALSTIRRTMEEVLKLDDRYMAGGAYRILGIIDYRLPRWAGGNPDRAKTRLLKCLEIAPTNPVTLFYLADYYWNRGDKTEARQWLKRFEQPSDPEFELEKSLIIKEEHKAIAKIEGSAP